MNRLIISVESGLSGILANLGLIAFIQNEKHAFKTWTRSICFFACVLIQGAFITLELELANRVSGHAWKLLAGYLLQSNPLMSLIYFLKITE